MKYIILYAVKTLLLIGMGYTAILMIAGFFTPLPEKNGALAFILAEVVLFLIFSALTYFTISVDKFIRG